MISSLQHLIINKRAQMPSFGWIFAIILGIAILFFAIFFVGRLIAGGGYQQAAELVYSFDILLNPFASIGGVGEVTLSKTISMPSEISLKMSCDDSGIGKQGISLRTRGAFGKWSEYTPEKGIYDKYIFTFSESEGKRFYVLSKSFELPFRVEDLIFIITEDIKYCFIDNEENIPSEIKNEFKALEIPNVKFGREQGEDCTSISFRSSQADIYVDCKGECNSGTVVKGEDELYFASSLLYGAIFSSPSMYKCNFNRLMERLSLLCEIYDEKAKKILDCQGVQAVRTKLNAFKNSIEKSDKMTSAKINALYDNSEELEDENTYASCQVF